MGYSERVKSNSELHPKSPSGKLSLFLIQQLSLALSMYRNVLPTYVSVFSLVLAGTKEKVLKCPLKPFLPDLSEISGGKLLS